MHNRRDSMTKAVLILEDGTVMQGHGFGAEGIAIGEIIFCTGMTGYVEALTDPSYKSQILTMTYPLIGNYGVNEEWFESDGIKVEGFVVKENCSVPSHHKSKKSIDEFLKEYNICGISDIDTRKLTKKIRTYGTMKAAIGVGDIDNEELLKKVKSHKNISELNLVPEVCTDKPIILGNGKKTVVLIDCGVKKSIVNQLIKKNVNLVIVPYDSNYKDILEYNPNGVFISNGPGDPSILKETINTVKNLIGKVPIYGICLGHQIISLALGAKTRKLKFGHHGLNQPIKDLENGRVYITSQNHNFAVSDLPDCMNITQINLNDNSIEGIKHKELPIVGVQYHPEAHPGPHDTYGFFDDFEKIIKQY